MALDIAKRGNSLLTGEANVALIASFAGSTGPTICADSVFAVESISSLMIGAITASVGCTSCAAGTDAAVCIIGSAPANEAIVKALTMLLLAELVELLTARTRK